MEIPQWLKTLVDRCEDEGQLWDVLTALRGPDIGSAFEECAHLKHLTTARIRAIVGCDECMWYEARETLLTPKEVETRNHMLYAIKGFGRMHFADHVSMALETLKGIGYDVPEEELDFSVGVADD